MEPELDTTAEEFRALKCAAPLKEIARELYDANLPKFRALKCAAPLKDLDRLVERWKDGLIPRTQMRGSVEGDTASTAFTCSGSEFRALKCAAPLKGCRRAARKKVRRHNSAHSNARLR